MRGLVFKKKFHRVSREYNKRKFYTKETNDRVNRSFGSGGTWEVFFIELYYFLIVYLNLID